MLRLGDHEWPLSGKFPGGLAMKISRAEANKDYRTAMSLSLRMASLLVSDEPVSPDVDKTWRDTLEDFVESDDFDVLDYEDISSAIAAAMTEATGRPTKKSSPSATGQTATGASSRDGSTSPGTVTELAPPSSYMFGRSAAS